MYPLPSCDYAGGWIVVERSWAGGLALNHGGSNTYLVCEYLARAGPRNFAILVATNEGGTPGEQATDQAVRALLQAIPSLS